MWPAGLGAAHMSTIMPRTPPPPKKDPRKPTPRGAGPRPESHEEIVVGGNDLRMTFRVVLNRRGAAAHVDKILKGANFTVGSKGEVVDNHYVRLFMPA